MTSGPTDPALRHSILDAVDQAVLMGEGFYFLGFDWEPRVSVRGSSVMPLAQEQADHWADRLCWRALVGVRLLSRSYKVTVLDICGDRIYGVQVLRSGQRVWKPVPDIDTRRINSLKRW